jgi:Spy/CpxP family protein refolding chaperone
MAINNSGDIKEKRSTIMKRMMFTALILLAMTALAASISAQPGPGRCGGSCDGNGPKHGARFEGHFGFGGGQGGQFDRAGGMGILRHADELDLSEEQENEIETMQTEFAKERIDLNAELKKAQIDLHELMRADNPDETAVSSAIDKTTSLKGDLAKMRFRHHQKVKSVLTADQIDKLKELPKRQFQRQGRRCGDGQGLGQGKGQGQGQNSDADLPRPRRDRSSW